MAHMTRIPARMCLRGFRISEVNQNFSDLNYQRLPVRNVFPADFSCVVTAQQFVQAGDIVNIIKATQIAVNLILYILGLQIPELCPYICIERSRALSRMPDAHDPSMQSDSHEC
jgi:hypothetical protein